MPPKRNHPRENIAEAVSEVLTKERIVQLLNDALALQTGKWEADARCPECDSARKILVRVPDMKAVVNTITDWIDQGFGRPGTEAGEPGGVTIVVEGSWFADLGRSEELAGGSSVLPGVAASAGGNEIGGEVEPSA